MNCVQIGLHSFQEAIFPLTVKFWIFAIDPVNCVTCMMVDVVPVVIQLEK